MVFFNCNSCGEALKKNQVEKHTFKCRQCNVLSCVDCGKDFWGDDYKIHTKCMTENEKYCGKDYVAKVNKGEAKQEAWIEKVQLAIDQASSHNNTQLKCLLVKLQDYPNIPRKKAKFENFLKNSLRILSPYLISQVWELLMTSTSSSAVNKENSAETKENSANQTEKAVIEKENESKQSLNKRERKEERQQKTKKEKKEKSRDPENEQPESKKKKKKRKHIESEEEDIEKQESKKSSKKRKTVANENCDENEEQEIQHAQTNGHSMNNEKFDWKLTIKAILNKKGEMSYKKLRRKVLQEFAVLNSANYKDENLHIVFDKKIRKMKHVLISDGRASITS